MENVTETKQNLANVSCTNCGSNLKFKAGTKSLQCDHCGTTNEIPQLEDAEIESKDYTSYFEKATENSEKLVEHFVACPGCGAESTLKKDVISASCPYCDTPLVVDNIKDESILKPNYLLPFKFGKEEAFKKFQKWLKGLWFAPSSVSKANVNTEGFKQIYLPYWIFDTDVKVSYIGQRGTYYLEKETYQTTESGKTVTKTKDVWKTRWTFVEGKIDKSLRDVLVVATNSLKSGYIDKLEPWDLNELVPYAPEYLSGTSSQKLQLELKEGFEEAKKKVEPIIYEAIINHIGGDTAQVTSKSNVFENIKFKSVMLPLFISAFRFKGKLFQFLINAQTGEVQGERPWSIGKIALTALAVIAAIMIYLLYKRLTY